jgi:flagellar protein FliS
MNSNNIYIENMVKTASPAKLIELLYSKAISLLKESIPLIDGKDLEKANEKIKRVQDIVSELNLSLNMEKGEAIAQNLRALYNYIYQKLLEANLKKDSKPLHEVLDLMESLNSVWKDAEKKSSGSQDLQRSRLNISI